MLIIKGIYALIIDLKEGNEMKRVNNKTEKIHLIFLAIFFIILIWSGIKPYSFTSWLLEALPAIIMVLVFVLIYKKYKFTTFAYLIVLIHAIILLIGSKYTYAENPFFNYLMQRFDMKRNYYDRLGHFAQGFTPAIIAKELLLRNGYLKRSKMFYYIVISIVLGLSAFYELLEFTTSLVSGVPGYLVLSYQGDEWDTQWDMVMALLGGLTALTLFGNLHYKEIKKTSGIDYKDLR